MNVAQFCASFDSALPPPARHRPTKIYAVRLKVKIKQLRWQWYPFDPLPYVEGMISVKKQRLLNLAYAHLETNEAYLEVGTWQGKSLISAMKGNPPRPTYACDNFSEFDQAKDRHVDLQAALRRNLTRYGLDSHVTFYNEPFANVFNKPHLPVPIGAYFYDAAHDEQSQYLGIKLVEPFLADQALVIVDDWRFAPDSQSYAKAGTERAIAESKDEWAQLYDLPARYNGDRALWWNGVAVFAFRRLRG